MSLTCICPTGEAIPTIPVHDCPETFGQIQKVAFQRLYKADQTPNGFSASADIKLKASWTALMAASDGTKIAISPYIQAPATEPGEPRTFGGGNESLSGIEEIIGREPTSFTGILRQVPQSVVKLLKELTCEGVNLGVYLFDEAGNIGAIKDGTTHKPIPIRMFFVSDKNLGGFENPDSNNVRWSFLPNWSDDLVKIKPTDFNPTFDLRPL